MHITYCTLTISDEILIVRMHALGSIEVRIFTLMIMLISRQCRYCRGGDCSVTAARKPTLTFLLLEDVHSCCCYLWLTPCVCRFRCQERGRHQTICTDTKYKHGFFFPLQLGACYLNLIIHNKAKCLRSFNLDIDTMYYTLLANYAAANI